MTLKVFKQLGYYPWHGELQSRRHSKRYIKMNIKMAYFILCMKLVGYRGQIKDVYLSKSTRGGKSET